MSSTVLPCLWTAQKTQKRKKWNEGEVRFTSSSKWVGLHLKKESSGRVEPEAMDGKYLEVDEYAAIVGGLENTFETEKHLVEVMPPEETKAVAPQLGGRLAALAALDGPTLKKFKKPVLAAPPARRTPLNDYGQPSNTGRPVRVVNYGNVQSSQVQSPDRRSPPINACAPSRIPSEEFSADGPRDNAQHEAEGSIPSWFADCPEDEPSQEDARPDYGSHDSHVLHQPLQEPNEGNVPQKGYFGSNFRPEAPWQEHYDQGGEVDRYCGYYEDEHGVRSMTCVQDQRQSYDVRVEESYHDISKSYGVDENSHSGANEASNGYSDSNSFCAHKQPWCGSSSSQHIATLPTMKTWSDAYVNDKSHDEHLLSPVADCTQAQPRSNSNVEEWLCACGVWSAGEKDQCDICGAPASNDPHEEVIESKICTSNERYVSSHESESTESAVVPSANGSNPTNFSAGSMWLQNEVDGEDGDLLDDLLDDGAQAQEKVSSATSTRPEQEALDSRNTKAPMFNLAKDDDSSDSESDPDA